MQQSLPAHLSSPPDASNPATSIVVDRARFAPLVDRIAMSLARRLPRSFEVAELVSVGWLGLLQAASRAPDGISDDEFEHFASCRVRGAMLDHLRTVSPAARERHNIHRQRKRAAGRARSALGRGPTELEIEAAMRKNGDTAMSGRSASCSFPVHSVELDETRVPSSWVGPEMTCQRNELVEILARAVEALPARDQLILSLYYRDDCTLREIGAVLGVSESRVSQILGAATAILKKPLGAN